MTSRLSPADLVRTAWLGVSSRPQRTALAALGVALGIASLVALTGAAASNRAQLLGELDAMGADLAVVAPATGPDQQPVPLPSTAPESIARQDGVAEVGVLETAPAGIAAYRTDLIPQTETNGLVVSVARPDALDAIGGSLAAGRWFDDASRALPVAVLGSVAAERLGIVQPGDRILVGGEWVGVLGVLDPAGLAAEIDTAVILGDRWVRDRWPGEGVGEISAIYVRAEPGRIGEVREVLAAAASPGSPFVSVTRLSDLAEARDVADDSLASLGVVLAGIALLVGGVGIANTMVVAVIERRGEIGLRRSLGARPGQIAVQFLAEAVLLAVLGGLIGSALGATAAAVIASVAGQPVVLPAEALLGGAGLSIAVGAAAGAHPAMRAARLAPTAALRGA